MKASHIGKEGRGSRARQSGGGFMALVILIAMMMGPSQAFADSGLQEIDHATAADKQPGNEGSEPRDEKEAEALNPQTTSPTAAGENTALQDWLERWNRADFPTRQSMRNEKEEFASQQRVAEQAGKGEIDGSGKFIPVPGPAAERTTGVPASAEKLARAGKPQIRRDHNGVVHIGVVSVDPKTRSIIIPAWLNSREGIIEYALVTRSGKVHEALFATDAAPMHVHLAALLLGLARDAGADSPATDGPSKVSIEVEWATNGPPRREPLEKLVALARESPAGPTGATLTSGSWGYAGSFVDQGAFAAEREGSLIALIGDPSALVTNPRPTHRDDNIHVPNTALLPSAGLPVTIHIRLATEPSEVAPPGGSAPPPH